MSEPTFFAVARRPRWIVALLLALSVAAIFASLAGWQADRTYRYIPKAPDFQPVVALKDLAKSSSSFLPNQADRPVTTQIGFIPGLAWVITNRYQLDGAGGTKNGFWVMRAGITEQGKFIPVAMAWFATEDEAARKATEVRAQVEDMSLSTISGIYEPSEDPRPSRGNTFDSVSVAQLINQPGLSESVDAYAGFLILQEPTFYGEKILIGQNPGEETFNWLTAFYAIEWTLFAGFAVFLWGRLVQDEVVRERNER
jgi:cytochrome oxidase assembly protein ShyY1